MSSGDKGVQGLQYLNYFSYSLKFLLLNVSLFYLKQDKRAFTTQIFPALVFSNEGGFYMSGNREYKSDVFSMLMQDKERALQLYNAMNGSSYDNPEDVEIVIHDGGISLSVRNDASFIVDARLSIYEHQSTVCPNMPVRSLIYFSVILSDMLSDKKKGTKKGKNIYGRRLVKIPTPHFVVFYNGEEEQPEVQELKLSDAFEKPTDEPNLELKCKVYNINDGKNKAIMESCGWLNDYMTFVNKVREYHADIHNKKIQCIKQNYFRCQLYMSCILQGKRPVFSDIYSYAPAQIQYNIARNCTDDKQNKPWYIHIRNLRIRRNKHMPYPWYGNRTDH